MICVKLISYDLFFISNNGFRNTTILLLWIFFFSTFLTKQQKKLYFCFVLDYFYHFLLIFCQLFFVLNSIHLLLYYPAQIFFLSPNKNRASDITPSVMIPKTTNIDCIEWCLYFNFFTIIRCLFFSIEKILINIEPCYSCLYSIGLEIFV